MADPVETTTATSGTPSGEGAAEGAATPQTTTSSGSAPEPNPLAQEVATLRAALQETRAESGQIKGYIVNLVSQLSQQAAQAADDGVDPKAKLREELEADPEATMNRLLDQRMGPILREQYAQQGVIAKEQAKRAAHESGWGEEWDSFAPQVEKFMEQVPLDRHLNPETWQHAFRLQIASDPHKFEELALKRAEKRLNAERAALSEGASPGRTGPKGPTPLSEAQKRMAKAFGISEDDYQKNLLAMQAEGLPEAS